MRQNKFLIISLTSFLLFLFPVPLSATNCNHTNCCDYGSECFPLPPCTCACPSGCSNPSTCPCPGTGWICSDPYVSICVLSSHQGIEEQVLSYKISDNGVILKWERGFNVQKWKILKKTDSSFDTIAVLSPEIQMYLDKDVSPGSIYSYKVLGNSSTGEDIIIGPITVKIPSEGSAIKVHHFYKEGTFEVKIVLPTPTSLKVSLVDVSGKVLYVNNFNEKTGIHIFTIPKSISPGTYFLQVGAEGEKFKESAIQKLILGGARLKK